MVNDSASLHRLIKKNYLVKKKELDNYACSFIINFTPLCGNLHAGDGYLHLYILSLLATSSHGFTSFYVAENREKLWKTIYMYIYYLTDRLYLADYVTEAF